MSSVQIENMYRGRTSPCIVLESTNLNVGSLRNVNKFTESTSVRSDNQPLVLGSRAVMPLKLPHVARYTNILTYTYSG